MTLWMLRPKGWPADYQGTCPFEAAEIAAEIGAGPWTSWYDKAYGFIVRAPDEATARRLAQAQAGAESRERPDVWLDADVTTCVEIASCQQGWFAEIGVGEAAVLMREFWRA